MRIRFRKKRKNTVPYLFDADFYLTNNEAAQRASCPWTHYCKVGFREGLDPNPLFSTRYYQHRYLSDDNEINPLLHYIETAGLTADTHPMFDSQNYLSQLGDVEVPIPLLEHFLKYNNENRISPCVFFDTKKYLFANPEVAPCGFAGLYHYIRFGKLQGRSHYVDHSLIASVFKRKEKPDYDWLLGSPQREVRFLATVLGLDSTKPTLVLCGNRADSAHQPTLKYCSKELVEQYNANVIHLFGFNPLETDSFAPWGPTFCLHWDDCHNIDHEHQLECAKAVLKNIDLLSVIYFDSHSSRTLTWLNDIGISPNSIVPTSNEQEFHSSIKEVAERSTTVRLPSRFQVRAKEFQAELQKKLSFFDTDFNAINNLQTTDLSPLQIKQKLGMDRDSILVVGTGDISYRTGFDRFVSIASSVLNDNNEANSTKYQFLWVGKLNTNDTQARGMIEELASTGYEDKILLCDDKLLANDAIKSADVLVMTHRANSESVAITDYLETGRPIVWFRGHAHVDRLMKGDTCEVPPGNVSKAVADLTRLSEDYDLNKSVCAENKKRFETATSMADFVYSIARPLTLKVLENNRNVDPDEPLHILKMPGISLHTRKRRRVIFTTPDWQISGVNTFVETLVNELNKLDFEAFVLFTSTKALAEQKSLLPDMPYQMLTHTPNLKPKTRRQLLQKYLKAMAPCVFVPNYDYNASTITPELGDNIATLGVLHSDDPQHYVHGYRMGPYWDQIVSVSQTIEDKLLDLNASFKDKSSVIRYGIRDEEKLIEPRTKTKQEKLRVVYTGRIIQQQKLIFDFVKVAETLNRHRDMFELVFVGDGPDFPEFQRQMEPYIQSGLVELMGRIKPDRINEVLHSCHVFALTSEYEGLPLSMLEALSAGLVPVVTAIESGIGEICEHERNALISPIGNPEALADNLLRIAKDTNLFNQLSKASRATFLSERLRAVDMAEQYATILDKMFEQVHDAGDERTEKLIYCPNIERMLNVA